MYSGTKNFKIYWAMYYENKNQGEVKIEELVTRLNEGCGKRPGPGHQTRISTQFFCLGRRC